MVTTHHTTSMESLMANLPAAMKAGGIPKELRRKDAGFDAFGLDHIGKEVATALAGEGWAIALTGKDATKVRLAFNLSARMAILNFHSVRNADTTSLYLGLRDEGTKEETIARVALPVEVVHGKCPVLMIRNAVMGEDGILPTGFSRWLAERVIEWLDEGGGVIIEGTTPAALEGALERQYGAAFAAIFTKGGLTV